MIINPIWSNTTYSEELESPFYEYHIDEGEEVLYAGKAYKRPDDESASFLVNDVAENFLTNHIKMDGGQMEDYVKAFTLKTSTGSEEEYVFYNDWSYKSGKTLLNEPINGRIDGRQHLFINYLNLNKPEMEVQMSINGGNWDPIIEGHSGYNAWASSIRVMAGPYVPIDVRVGWESVHYTMSCADYCLYYINAYGGWDSLLVDGNVKRVDEITSSEMYVKKATNSLDFGKTKYLNTITPTWTLYTGVMTDEEASRMHHLLESTEVYLHNLKEDVITPVIIRNSNCEYQTYTTNGRKLPHYTIEVEASVEKYRK